MRTSLPLDNIKWGSRMSGMTCALRVIHVVRQCTSTIRERPAAEEPAPSTGWSPDCWRPGARSCRYARQLAREGARWQPGIAAGMRGTRLAATRSCRLGIERAAAQLPPLLGGSGRWWCKARIGGDKQLLASDCADGGQPLLRAGKGPRSRSHLNAGRREPAQPSSGGCCCMKAPAGGLGALSGGRACCWPA